MVVTGETAAVNAAVAAAVGAAAAEGAQEQGGGDLLHFPSVFGSKPAVALVSDDDDGGHGGMPDQEESASTPLEPAVIEQKRKRPIKVSPTEAKAKVYTVISISTLSSNIFSDIHRPFALQRRSPPAR